MSKVLMIESCEKKTVLEDFSNTSIVHVRNSITVAKELGYKLVTHASQIPEAASSKWDHIVCVYASPYMKYKAYMEIIDNNPDAKLWFFVNDHDLEDNVLLRNMVKKYHKKYHVICNNQRSGYRHWILGKKLEGGKLNDWIDEWHTVNLNSLIFNNAKCPVKSKDKNGTIYFGTFRKHRAKDMAQFNGIKNYTISSSTKNQDKYRAANIEAEFIDKLDWTLGSETLNNYKYSIYFEDLHTHSNFAYLANRFYECLMCDVLIFFDAKCEKTIEESRKMGYIIDDLLVVSNADEMNATVDFLNNNEKEYKIALSNQRKNIAVAERHRTETLNQIQSILS